MKTSLKFTVVVTICGLGSLARAVTVDETGAIDLSTAGVNLLPVTSEKPAGLTGYVTNVEPQPTGTGVFKPFLSLKSKADGAIEHAYNYSDDVTNVDYLDHHRDQWNSNLRFGDLQSVTLSGKGDFFVFTLDADEPGVDKSLISIDNVRLYTSANEIVTTVQNDVTKLDTAATLRWSLNDPVIAGDPDALTDPTLITPWIKLDASLRDTGSNANGGNGIGDMLLYIPVSAFAGVNANDYVWFYNLNGVHYKADSDLGATSSFEEWSALVKTTSVPDGGATAALLGFGLLGVGFAARRFTPGKA